MNRYNLNILTQIKRMTQMIQSNQSINSVYVGESSPFWGKSSIWPILEYYESIQLIQSTSPSKSIDSVTYFMKTNRLSHQSNHLEKELNRLSQFFGKRNRFKSINSVETASKILCRYQRCRYLQETWTYPFPAPSVVTRLLLLLWLRLRQRCPNGSCWDSDSASGLFKRNGS